MSLVGVPVMTKASFIATERDFGEHWKFELQQSMAEAGQEEKRLAEERGSNHEGAPAITVIVDGGGLSAHINTPIMPNLVWPSLLGKRLVDCFTLGCVTSSVKHVPEGFHKKTTLVTRTGVRPHLRWRRTLSWRGFWRLRKCMDFATPNSLAMVIVLCILLSSRMFLDEAMPFKSLSVQTTHASAIVVHLSNSSRTTPPTRAVEA